MTTNTTASIKAQISATQATMAADKALADQLAAMQAAALRVAEGARALEHLGIRLAEAETAERMRAGALAKYTIVEVKPNAPNPTPASAHAVTYIERTHDMPDTVRTLRLSGITDDVRMALADDSEKIPAYILALDADPYEALRQHAWHAGRGYWSAPANYANGQPAPMSAPGTMLAPGVAQL